MVAVMEDRTAEDVGLEFSTYEVLYGTFGQFQRGEVIPHWWLRDKKHSIPTLIENGVIKRTNAPVSPETEAKLIGDAPKSEVDPTPTMQREIDRLKLENERLAQDNRLLLSERNELKSQSKLADSSLGQLTMEIGRLKRQLQESEAAKVFAETQLNQLTKPKAVEVPVPVPEPKPKNNK